jgi:hypothetical protein
LLDEFCEQYHFERKYAIKLLGDAAPAPRSSAPRPGPEPKYSPLTEVVTTIWRAAEQVCGKRLVHALPLWLSSYERHHGKLLPTQKKLLAKVSAATLDRLLAEHKANSPKGLCGTRPGTLLRHQVPIQGEVWNEKRIGFIEADSVAHCGSSLAGDFIWSLTYTDLACTWTEGRAVWNKGATGVLEQTKDVEIQLPFPIVGFDFDNGSEWLNWTLIRRNALATVSQRRQCSRRTEKLDVAASIAGLWPAGRTSPVAPDQSSLQRSLGTFAEFLFALHEADQQRAHRCPVGATARPATNRLPTTFSQRPIEGSQGSPAPRTVSRTGPV